MSHLQVLHPAYCSEFPDMPSRVDISLAALDTSHRVDLSTWKPVDTCNWKPDEFFDEELPHDPSFAFDNFCLMDYALDDDYSESVMVDSQEEKILLQSDCMWSGCFDECRKNHKAIPFPDFDNLLSLSNRQICESSMDNEEKFVKNKVTNAVVSPYTPTNDHCYSQPKHLENCKKNGHPKDISISDAASESSEDEVDVVTVTDEYIHPVIQTVPEIRRIARPRKLARKQTAKSKTAANLKSTLKAASSALKRTRLQSQVNTKRRKTAAAIKINSLETSPESSLASSCASSRCNSDTEDSERRNTHNDSERKRREVQRSALQMLKCVIPELKNDDRAAKVKIIEAATVLARELVVEQDKLKDETRQQMKRKKHLEKKLASLNKMRLAAQAHIS